MNNGYTLYVLRLIAAQGALASVYTDPRDPEGFCAGFVECVSNRHLLMAEVTPWGKLDGWRLRRTSDVLQVLSGEEYEQRLAMLLSHYRQQHVTFFESPLEEEDDILRRALQHCQEKRYVISVLIGDEMLTGRVKDLNDLRVTLHLMDFFGRPAEEETVPLRDIEVLSIDTEEERMYELLERLDAQRPQLLPPEEE